MLNKLDRSLLLKGEIEPTAKNALNEATKSSDSTSGQSFESYFSEPQNRSQKKTQNKAQNHNEASASSNSSQASQANAKSEQSEEQASNQLTNFETKSVEPQSPAAPEGIVIRASSDTRLEFLATDADDLTSTLSEQPDIGFFELMVGMKELSLKQSEQSPTKGQTQTTDEILVNIASDSQQQQITVNKLIQQSGVVTEDLDTTSDTLVIKNIESGNAVNQAEFLDMVTPTSFEATGVLIDEQHNAELEETSLHPEVEAFLTAVTSELSVNVNDNVNDPNTGKEAVDGRLVDDSQWMNSIDFDDSNWAPVVAQLQQSVDKLNQAYQQANPETKAVIVQQLNRLIGSEKTKDTVPMVAPNVDWSESELPLKIEVQQVIKDIVAIQTQAQQTDGNRVLPLAGVIGQLMRDHQNASEHMTVTGQSLTEDSLSNANASLTSSTQTTRAPTEIANSVIHLQRSDAHKKLAETVSVMINQRHLLADIRLDPADLGMMQIKVNMQGEQANISFVVQSQQTQQLMEQSLQRLKELLNSQGVEVGDTFVSHDEQAFENQQQEGGDPDSQLASEGEQLDDETSDVAVEVVDDGRIDDFA